MLKEGRLVCDRCQTPITRVTDVPADGWPTMHNLCSACFAKVRNAAVPR